MDNKLKRTPGVYLAGFMGSGKTTVGRKLADHLGWEFVDVDDVIEAQERAKVADIFEQRGEAEFRRLETDVIRSWTRRIERGHPAVVALGGGAFVQPESFDLLANHGISIWLDCPFETIQKRIADEVDNRPLARGREALHKLYQDRREGYGRADYTVNADCDIDFAIQQILQLPVWK
jgi:shikimate kinase